MERRQKIKERAEDRHNALLAAQGFQEFKRDADEVSSFSHNINNKSINQLKIKVGLQFLKDDSKVEICKLTKINLHLLFYLRICNMLVWILAL